MANNSINVNFAQSDIQEIRMGAENTLEIILKDGSVVGYTDMGAASPNSFIMFSDGKALEISSLVETLENGDAWNILDSYIVENIGMPVDGGTQSIELGAQSIIHFDFDLADAVITQNENRLEINMGGAGSIVVSGVNGMEAIQLANGEIVDLNILLNGSTEDAAQDDMLYAEAQDSAEQVASIEPASGDIAEQLAAIEPAAGDTGAAAGGRGGFGFGSTFSSEQISPLNEIGPLNPTALQYGIQFVQDQVLPEEDIAAQRLVTPPEIDNGSDTALEIPLSATTLNGTLPVFFGADGFGSITPGGTGFAPSGSIAGGTLTSLGEAVLVSQTATGYVGATATGRPVFEINFDAVGGYEFIIHDGIDHADPLNPTDVIDLEFGFIATDGAGDAAEGTFTINVVDSVPVAADDFVSMTPFTDITADGNVVTGVNTGGADTDSDDVISTVTDVDGTAIAGVTTLTGAFGTLEIGTDGEFEYTLYNNWAALAGVDYSVSDTYDFDTFTYTYTDFDGDSDTATLSFDGFVAALPPMTATPSAVTVGEDLNIATNTFITTSDDNTVNAVSPVGDITSVAYNGTHTSNVGALTSNGSAVTVTATATGLAGTDAAGATVFDVVFTQNAATGAFEYTYTQYTQLDHEEGGASDDTMSIEFGVTITNEYGLTVDSTVTANVNDDNPIAQDDAATLADGVISVTGSVTANDEDTFSVDADNTVTGYTITGTYGTFTVDAAGDYTYTLNPNWATTAGVDFTSTNTYVLDSFDYTLTDGDGDADTAQITFDKVVNKLADPTATPSAITVTEDAPLDSAHVISSGNVINATSPNGAITAVAYNDGTFTSNLTGGLVSNGSAVNVTSMTNGIIGQTATGAVIFDVVFTQNAVTGDFEYTYTQYAPLDHEEGLASDDTMTLNFGVTVTDEFGLTTTTTLTANVNDDNPLAKADSDQLADGDTVANGNVLADNGNGIDELSADEANTVSPVSSLTGTYGNLELFANGSYIYTLNANWATTAGVDFSVGGTFTLDSFNYLLTDGDGDTSTTTLDFTKLVNALAAPTLEAQDNVLTEERNADPSKTGDLTVTGTNGGVNSIEFTGTFNATGSLEGGALTFQGTAITTSYVGNTYTGMAGAVKVFELTLNPATSKYEFTLFETLDHEVENVADDITLSFEVKVTDDFGLSATDAIDIKIIDDLPVAQDDTKSLADGANTVAGNVITNDIPTFSADDQNLVIADVVNGTYGQLVLNADGSYDYTLSANWDAGVNYAVGATLVDTFTYTLIDGDTDTDTATLTITKTVGALALPELSADDKLVEEQRNADPDTSGHIVTNNVNGGIASLELVDGSFAASGSLENGALTFQGTPIVTTLTGNTYTGMAGAVKVFELTLDPVASDYEFTLFETIDHEVVGAADLVDLSFDVKVTDAYGLTATDTIDITIKDDLPFAKDDAKSLGNSNTVNGNVLANDTLSADDVNVVLNAGVLTGTYGELVLDADGDYTYSLYAGWDAGLDYSVGGSVSDTFTYTLIDGDDDTAQADLVITKTVDSLGIPEVEAIDSVLKEDLPMGPSTSGLINVTGANGGVASITPVSGSFSFGGSSTAPTLSHNGVAIVVTVVGSSFIGMAGATKVFALDIVDGASPHYDFTLFETLDHLDANNPVDEIDLSFDISVTDNFGLVGTDTIDITIIDDAPIANDDSITFNANDDIAVGNVVTANDELSADHDNHVTSVKFGGQDYDVPAAGDLVIDGNNGTLTIDADGNYEYDLNDDILFKETTYTFTKDTPPGSDAGGDIKNVDTAFNENTGEFTFEMVIANPHGRITEGFTVALNNGPNPKGHGGELALFYFDASNGAPVVSVYAYNGMNTQTSWKDGDAAGGTQAPDQIASSLATDSPFTSITVTTDANGNQVYSFTMDATGVNNFNPTYGDASDWTGMAFDDALGIWLHPVADLATSYDADGYLTEWFPQAQGYYDTSNQTTTKEVVCRECVGDVFEYTLTDSDGDSDTALLDIKACPPTFIVGENVDDILGETTEYRVGDDSGVITGSAYADVLVGDVGGSTFIPPVPQDYNFVLILDTSGSMGSKTDNSRLNKLIQAVESLTEDLTAYDNGAIRVHITPFGSEARTSATFDITDQASADTLISWLKNTMAIGGSTNYEAALQEAIGWLQTPSAALGGNAETYTYFISDGEPNKYVTASGALNSGFDTDEAINQFTGSDGTNEAAIIQSLSTEVIGVGIQLSNTALSRIDLIDSDGSSLNITNPDDLTAALKNSNPITGLSAVGGDVLNGNDGDDVIFGDSLNSDALGAAQGITATEGAGWDVFAALENGEGNTADWGRDDTLAYIIGNAEELGAETNIGGVTRGGGDDVISGGAGNDVIFGQEGNDVISGGAGNDVLYGGSGNDTFMFEALTDGLDIIKDFEIGQDNLDLTSLVSITDPVTQAIEDFVFANDDGAGNTVVSIDSAGSGDINNATAVTSLEGVDVDLNDLIASLLVA
jgi:T1SS-143 domain-containing protein